MHTESKWEKPLEVKLSDCISSPAKRKWKKGGLFPLLATEKLALYQGKFRRVYMLFSHYVVFCGKSRIEIEFI